MSLRFIFGNSGAGKSYTLFSEVIRRSVMNPETGYLVIVPEQFTMQTQKELVRLHPSGGILNIDVLSFQRLAYRVFEETAAQTGSVLEETGKNLVLRKLALDHEGELKIFGGNLRKAGYIGEIKSIVSELSQYAVTEEDLEGLISRLDGNPALQGKLREILVLYRAFHEYLADGYVTAEEIPELLIRVADRSALIRESVIVLDGFTGFTPLQNRLMQKLIRISKEVIVTVTIDPRENPYIIEGGHELFALSKKTISTLTGLAEAEHVRVERPVIVGHTDKSRFGTDPDDMLLHLEQNIFRKRPKAFEGRLGNSISLHVLRNPESEVAWAASQIQKMVMEEGYRYRDFAIITGDMEEYSPVLERVLPACGIPCFIDNKKSVLKNPFVEYVRALIEIAQQDMSYESMFRFLRNALSGMEPEDVDILENYVLATGIRGTARWGRPFDRLCGGLDEAGLAGINELRQRAAGELVPFVKAVRVKNADVRTRTTAVYRFIESNSVQGRLSAMEEDFKSEGLQVQAKEYHQIYSIVMDLFDKLVDFLGDEKVSLKEYSEILDAGFSDAKVGVIPPGVDQAVAGDMERTRLNGVKVLFFLGVNEGSVPKSSRDGGLLSDIDRDLIKESGVELAPTARENAYTQRFYLYLALTKPSRRLLLSCTLLDSEGASRRPSYLMGTMERLFPGLKAAAESENEVPFSENEAWRLLSGGLGRIRADQAEPEEEARKTFALYRRFSENEDNRGKLDGLLSAAFDVHRDTCLSKAVAHALYGETLSGSVTRLEKYASCAYSHFLTYGLMLSEREAFEFAPADVGNVIHDTLESFSIRLDESGYDWKTVPDETAASWAAEALERVCGEYGNGVLTGSARDAYNIKRMERMLLRTIHTLKLQISGGEFVPAGYEVPFYVDEDLGAGGGRMKLRGRIDRIDICADGDRLYVKVIDYKTGSKSFSLSELFHGIQIQLPVYLDEGMKLMKRKYPGMQVEPAGLLYYKVEDPFLDEDTGESEAEDAMLKKLKPDGIVSSDPDVLKKLDSSMPGKSKILPVSFNNNGSLRAGSKAATSKQLNDMTEFVGEKMRHAGAEILDGRMEASPYELKGRRPCEYCGYKGVCGFDSGREGFRVRRLPVFPDSEIWKMIDGDGAD